MELIADTLLMAGALGAGLYCLVLARRLRRFTDLEQGVGGAIAVLSAQVDDLTKTLGKAQRTAAGSGVKLEATTERAEAVAGRLELLIAAMHDLPEPEAEGGEPVAAEPEDTPVVTLFQSNRSRVEAAE